VDGFVGEGRGTLAFLKVSSGNLCVSCGGIPRSGFFRGLVNRVVTFSLENVMRISHPNTLAF
jgi:hypothetical protein